MSKKNISRIKKLELKKKKEEIKEMRRRTLIDRTCCKIL